MKKNHPNSKETYLPVWVGLAVAALEGADVRLLRWQLGANSIFEVNPGKVVLELS